MTRAPIDRFLPDFDLAERHEISIRATQSATFEALRDLDMGQSRIVRILFRIRGLPTSAMTLAGLEKLRFVPLHEEPPRHLVLGLIGRFWTPSGELRRFEPAEFSSYQRPGVAKAVWSFTVSASSAGGSTLQTETRVQCTDAGSRRRFKLYWTLVGPFSGWIRREVLRLAREAAEERRWPEG